MIVRRTPVARLARLARLALLAPPAPLAPLAPFAPRAYLLTRPMCTSLDPSGNV
jgi:hypothetical protein